MVSVRGPIQFFRSSHLVNASNTNARGASTTRRVVKLVLPASAMISSFLDVMWLLLRLQCLEVLVETAVARFPELAVGADPLGRLFQRLRLEVARPPLGLAAARDQPRPLEHL